MKNIVKSCSILTLALSCSAAFAYPMPLLLKNNKEPQAPWTQEDSIKNTQLTSIKQSDDTLIGIGKQFFGPYLQEEKPAILKSSDHGKTWTASNPSLKKLYCPTGKDDTNLYSLIKGKDTWVATGGHSTLLVSKDEGATWTSASFNTEMETECPTLRSVAWNGQSFMAVGDYNDYEPSKKSSVVAGGSHLSGVILQSDDGVKWEALQIQTGPHTGIDGILKRVAWDKDNQQWLIAGYDKYNRTTKVFLYSIAKDGKTWKSIALPSEVNRIQDMIIEDSTWTLLTQKERFAISSQEESPFIIRSSNYGKTWEVSDSFPTGTYVLNALSTNQKEWAVVGLKCANDGSACDNQTGNFLPTVLTSKNGTTDWQSQLLPKKVMDKTALSHSYKQTRLKDILWNGAEWIATGSYDKPNPGCETFKGSSTGVLQTSIEKSGTGKQTIVATLNIFGVNKGNSSNDKYTVNGEIDYIGAAQSHRIIGLEGVCIEDGEKAVLQLYRSDLPTKVSAEKRMESDLISVTESYLLDNGPEGEKYMNFTGTLTK
jgi:photosystem II stability/assembly factor-like uncharacterized protein